MKERKELTTGKATAYILILYSIFTSVLGIVFAVINNLAMRYLPPVVGSIISVVISIALIYAAWELSVILTLKNRNIDGLDIKKIIRFMILFIVITSVISMGMDIYRHTESINNDKTYSKDFLQDKDVIAAVSQEQLQERANEIDRKKAEVQKAIYTSAIMENVVGMVINIIIITLVPKARLEKYDGVAQMEKSASKS